jgi:glucosamine-6-phosphate deaminase
MSVLIYRDPEIVGSCAAILVASHLLTDPKCTIGMDYHDSLLSVFDELSVMTERGLINWSDAKIYQLFEFVPTEASGQRISNLLGDALFAKAEISEQQYVVPFSTELSPKKTADAFEQSILNDGGLDVALLAIRRNGSLLMNQTTDSDLNTHLETVDGDGFITAGLATLMQVKHPILVATGKAFAEAVRTMLKGSLTESPLAALRMHPGVTILLDEEAAELL